MAPHSHRLTLAPAGGVVSAFGAMRSAAGRRVPIDARMSDIDNTTLPN